MFARITGRDIRQRLDRDAAALTPPSPGPVVTEERVASLPEVVQRYFRIMGVLGFPAVSSFRAHLTGRFRLREGQQFMPVQVWQYSTVDPIARLFWMRISMAGGVLPMVGLDSYVEGRGRMRGRLLDTVVVADGVGEAFDVGELTTWLNDAVMLSPSMLLTAGAEFSEVDERCFDVSLTDAGRTVRARVVVDDAGLPVDFHTEDRWADLPGGPVRSPWSTPVEGWQYSDGRPLPKRASAVWHLPDGDLTYAILDFGAEAVEENPVLDPPARDTRPLGATMEAAGGAVAIVATVIGSPLLRSRYNRWGATQAECRAALPGDELVPDPRLESTRAITIDAPPDAVWPWLAQLGQGRGGLYSYDALENLLGLQIHSADRILPQHQDVAPGDPVRLGKPGSPCFSVASVEAERSLVLVSAQPVSGDPVPTPVRDGSGATWQWVLQPTEGGRATRLVTRQRNTHPDSQRVLWGIVEPIGFVMERRMLQGIKSRSERLAGVR